MCNSKRKKTVSCISDVTAPLGAQSPELLRGAEATSLQVNKLSSSVCAENVPLADVLHILIYSIACLKHCLLLVSVSDDILRFSVEIFVFLWTLKGFFHYKLVTYFALAWIEK